MRLSNIIIQPHFANSLKMILVRWINPKSIYKISNSAESNYHVYIVILK
ncbi:hypothetical protein F960_03293 [Acinetobacter gerneri DSM 14967 = CIP 107464 = MTCC 9824]|uniref:Uncharacterized protein n=1 Tax=Acinetobacter gerneri DSM 14967 = CIP 107464 = MTCC 9824 TaxID=1120926 RepID=N8ZM29_9GAMM|nr:hypothetical protein F960_03293 [Acinetobacter gerneri DSM 14967 = CIP 107464 = MTCC 9824]